MPNGLPADYLWRRGALTSNRPVRPWAPSYVVTAAFDRQPLLLRTRRSSSAVRPLAGRRFLGHPLQENTMGKYLLAWLLGVPGIVLLIVYLFFH